MSQFGDSRIIPGDVGLGVISSNIIAEGVGHWRSIAAIIGAGTGAGGFIGCREDPVSSGGHRSPTDHSSGHCRSIGGRDPVVEDRQEVSTSQDIVTVVLYYGDPADLALDTTASVGDGGGEATEDVVGAGGAPAVGRDVQLGHGAGYSQTDQAHH